MKSSTHDPQGALSTALGSAAQNAILKAHERTGVTPATATASFRLRTRDGRVVRYRVRVEREG